MAAQYVCCGAHPGHLSLHGPYINGISEMVQNNNGWNRSQGQRAPWRRVAPRFGTLRGRTCPTKLTGSGAPLVGSVWIKYSPARSKVLTSIYAPSPEIWPNFPGLEGRRHFIEKPWVDEGTRGHRFPAAGHQVSAWMRPPGVTMDAADRPPCFRPFPPSFKCLVHQVCILNTIVVAPRVSRASRGTSSPP